MTLLEYINGFFSIGVFVIWLRGGGGVGEGMRKFGEGLTGGWGGVGEGLGEGLAFHTSKTPVGKKPMNFP